MEIKGEDTGPSVWKRLAACLLDILLINIIIIAPFQEVLLAKIPASVSFGETYGFLASHPETVMLLNSIILLVGVFTFFYFMLLEYTIGQTFGKIIMNLKVESKGGLPGFLQSMGRSLFLIPVFPFTLILVADIVYLIIHRDRRLSEQFTHTKVVQVI
jgi:uncharacterized RDD family membrane protein YckC